MPESGLPVFIHTALRMPKEWREGRVKWLSNVLCLGEASGFRLIQSIRACY
jgi:hypothetical protein